MASQVKGFIGDQTVELNNAATESTLAAMLAIAKADSAVLRNMAAKAGVDAATIKKAADALEKQSVAASSAAGGLGDVAPKASLMGGFLMDMGASAMKTMGNLVQFGDELVEGKARASDLFKAFKDLPLGLGLLAAVFEKAMKYQEKNLDVYQAISKSGVGLNGSLASLRTTAAGMGVTLDELTEVMTKNADVMRSLGGAASLGSKAFTNINKQLMQGGLGTELLELGYSFKDVNNLLGGYLRVSGDSVRVGKDLNAEQSRLAKAAAHYGKELDFMSRLTGESREALEAKMAAEAQEASWQLHLAGMDEEGRKKANDALMRANALGGKGAMDTLKASIMGYAAPFSAEGQMYTSTMRDGTKALQNMADVVKDGSKAEQAASKMDSLYAKGMAGNIKDIASLKNVISAMGQGGTESAKGLMDVVTAAQSYISSGRKSEDAIKLAMIETRKKTEDDKKAAAAAVANEKAMKAMSNQVNAALLPIMELLAKHASSVVQSFATFIKEVDFEKLGQQVAKFMSAVTEYIKYLFDPAGREKIINDIKNLFKELLIELKYAINPFFSKYDANMAKNEILLNNRVMEARAKESQALETRNALNQKIYDAEHQESLKAKNEELAARAKTLSDNKERSAEQDEELGRINSAMAENSRRLKASAELVDPKNMERAQKSLSGLEADLAKKRQDTADYTERYKRYEKAGFDPNKVTEDKAKWNYETGEKKFANGTAGTGSLLQDFGKGTRAELHGKEAVVNEAQLTNIVKGVGDAGTAQAQNALANALNTLNKQQALTNQILDRIADNTKRASEGGRWGNAFARV